MLNRTTEPAIHEAVEFDLILKPYDHFLLNNSIPVYAINGGAQSVVMIEWVFYAGNWYEQKNMVAATTNTLLKNGTATKTALEINEFFDYYGAFLNCHCFNEIATVTLYCLTKYVEQLLPVVSEILSESIFPEEELLVYRQNQKQKLEVNLKKCDFVANRLIDISLYGKDHPYGKHSSAIEYDLLQRDDLIEFYDQFYKSGKCLVFVAGKLPENIAEILNNNFGSLTQQELPVIQHTIYPEIIKNQTIINDENGVQAAIRIASAVPSRHHPDFIKLQILNNIFGGYFGSRLMSNIREDKGYTYSIHSFLQTHFNANALMISTEAGRDVYEPCIKEIYVEMKRLREELISDYELHLVQNFMMGSILGNLDGPFQIISRWKTYILNDLGGDFFYRSLKTIKTITSKELQEIANKYLAEENFYQLSVI